MGSLALDLFREVRPGLFRVLAGRNAGTYVDVLDALEIESSQRYEGMTRAEALAIVAYNLAQYPEFNPDEPEIQDDASGEFISLPPPERARRLLDYLARLPGLAAKEED